MFEIYLWRVSVFLLEIMALVSYSGPKFESDYCWWDVTSGDESKPETWIRFNNIVLCIRIMTQVSLLTWRCFHHQRASSPSDIVWTSWPSGWTLSECQHWSWSHLPWSEESKLCNVGCCFFKNKWPTCISYKRSSKLWGGVGTCISNCEGLEYICKWCNKIYALPYADTEVVEF